MEDISYYFDSVSTTKPYPEVIKLHNELLNKYYANSDALYRPGIETFKLLEQARFKICELGGYQKDELIFTSGASEANNLAFKGVVFSCLDKKPHVITTAYEHSSVLNQCKQLERLFNIDITYLKPNINGVIEPDDLINAIKPNTILVSIMAVNNEIGAINDIATLAKITKKKSNAYFHSDITQAFGKIKLNLKDVDMASFSAHKFHGLKGSGGLFKKKYVHIEPLIVAGQQEYGLRGGTSNYIGALTMAKALLISYDRLEKDNLVLDKLMAYMEDKFRKINGIKIVDIKNHINNLLILTTPLTSEVMLNALNAKKIYVSSKSTCGTKTKEVSASAILMNYDGDHALRISLTPEIKYEDIDYLCESIEEVIEKYGKIKL